MDVIPSGPPLYSVVILAKDEQDNIKGVLQSTAEVLQGQGGSFELIVVDGHSKDLTAERAQNSGARVITQSKPGYAAALCEGLAAARGNWILTLDADGSHDPSLIPALISASRDADIVIGSRWIRGGAHHGSMLRKITSRFLNVVFTRILALPISDVSSGYRIYRRRALLDHYTCTDFSILEEILVRAHTAGFRVREVPLQYQERTSGESHVKPLQFSVSYCRALWKMWLFRFDASGADYEHRAFTSKNYIQRYWQRKRVSNITYLLKELSASDGVLDVGCGSSRLTQSLPGSIGCDVAIQKVRYLRALGVPVVQGSVLALPFQTGTFGAIIQSQVLGYVPNERDLFREVWRVLRPGGLAIIGTVDSGRPWWPIIERIYRGVMPHAGAYVQISRHSKESLTAMLVEHGFEILAWKTIFGAEITVVAQKK